MKTMKRAIALFLSLSLLLLVSACKARHQDAVIYYEIPEKPHTLDPQTASTDAELSLVRNLFEGLLRKDEDGDIVCGAASSYSYDNLTYTFRLRGDAVWEDEKPVTADDFVFAFRRAVDPATRSPFASRLRSVANAEKIMSGTLAATELGVTAEDEETLVIRMQAEDGMFEDTLTTSICMPCRESFFESCQGQYGLEQDCLIANGSYRLAKWIKDPFDIRLYKNEKYSGKMKAQNSAVFVTRNEKKATFDRLVDNNVDIAFVDSSLSGDLEDQGLKTKSFEDTCWVLTLSGELSDEFRKAFAFSTGKEVYGGSLPDGYRGATSLYPAALLKDPPKTGMPVYNLEEAKKQFTAGISRLPQKKFPSGVILTYYDNAPFKSVVTDIVGHWQNKLGAFVNIEATKENLAGQLTDQTLTMAIFPYKTSRNEMVEYLKGFGVDYRGEGLEAVQNSVLSGQKVIPIAFQDTTVAYASTLKEVFIEPENGYMDFAFFVKNE